MPKNKGKGGKNRRRGKNENDDMKRELILAEPGQAYAQVLKMLGNGRLEAMCFDGQKRLCHIRGKLRKKVWINTSDVILIGLRDFQDEKADVILKYNADEVRVLKNKKQIPENVTITDTTSFGQDQGGDDIFFDEQFSDDESDNEESDAKGSSIFGNGNLNRNSNITRDPMADITDSDEDDEEEEEDE
ncbi:Eukaryotic translation initiation factor X-chromosomal [Brachionus plicatilis]|uniref:Eukaryotic translation initiation factor 4C n=1 Tax=Brachionus plicatilis TaxID=10195 RepID=A0A3M7PXR9_BRAPC|nr:Eukaryotic translation initiation factor X-chromosomal [Brachionus plicatilis]